MGIWTLVRDASGVDFGAGPVAPKPGPAPPEPSNARGGGQTPAQQGLSSLKAGQFPVPAGAPSGGFFTTNVGPGGKVSITGYSYQTADGTLVTVPYSQAQAEAAAADYERQVGERSSFLNRAAEVARSPNTVSGMSTATGFEAKTRDAAAEAKAAKEAADVRAAAQAAAQNPNLVSGMSTPSGFEARVASNGPGVPDGRTQAQKDLSKITEAFENLPIVRESIAGEEFLRANAPAGATGLERTSTEVLLGAYSLTFGLPAMGARLGAGAVEAVDLAVFHPAEFGTALYEFGRYASEETGRQFRYDAPGTVGAALVTAATFAIAPRVLKAEAGLVSKAGGRVFEALPAGARSRLTASVQEAPLVRVSGEARVRQTVGFRESIEVEEGTVLRGQVVTDVVGGRGSASVVTFETMLAKNSKAYVELKGLGEGPTRVSSVTKPTSGEFTGESLGFGGRSAAAVERAGRPLAVRVVSALEDFARSTVKSSESKAVARAGVGLGDAGQAPSSVSALGRSQGVLESLKLLGRNVEVLTRGALLKYSREGSLSGSVSRLYRGKEAYFGRGVSRPSSSASLVKRGGSQGVKSGRVATPYLTEGEYVRTAFSGEQQVRGGGRARGSARVSSTGEVVVPKALVGQIEKAVAAQEGSAAVAKEAFFARENELGGAAYRAVLEERNLGRTVTVLLKSSEGARLAGALQALRPGVRASSFRAGGFGFLGGSRFVLAGSPAFDVSSFGAVLARRSVVTGVSGGAVVRVPVRGGSSFSVDFGGGLSGAFAPRVSSRSKSGLSYLSESASISRFVNQNKERLEVRGDFGADTGAIFDRSIGFRQKNIAEVGFNDGLVDEIVNKPEPAPDFTGGGGFSFRFPSSFFSKRGGGGSVSSPERGYGGDVPLGVKLRLKPGKIRVEADLASIIVSEALYGKATTGRSRKRTEEFALTGSLAFPTEELRRGRR